MARSFSLATSLLFCVALGLPNAADAQCTLPNQLTNGQTADASQVMANFNSLVDCKVGTSGSPGTGGLITLSSPTTITSGDLSGEVTTSGTLNTTLSNTGVVAGSYTNANITVDAKGRILSAGNGSGGGGSGGSSAPEALWTAPSVANFDTIRSGTGALTNFTEFGVSGVLISAPATSVNSNSLIYGVNTIIPGANGWRITARIRRTTPLVSWGMMGIILRNATSGSSVTYGLGVDATTGINRDQFADDTTFDGVSDIVPWYELDMWLRITDDLTSRHVYISKDGFEWQEIYTEPRTSYVTPTQAGVFMNPNFGRGNNITGKNFVGMKIYSLTSEAL